MINKKDREDFLKITQNKKTIDEATQKEISLIINQNKKLPRRRSFKLFTLSFSCICLLICLILPTIALVYSHTSLSNPSAPTLTYYADDEADLETLTSDQTKNLISSNFSKYDFLLNPDEFNFSTAFAYYAKDDHELLAIYINVNEIAIPMTTIQFYLKISERFIFREHNLYISETTMTETANYKLYKKIIRDYDSNATMLGYAKFNNHEFYLNLNFEHDDLFNKFL